MHIHPTSTRKHAQVDHHHDKFFSKIINLTYFFADNDVRHACAKYQIINDEYFAQNQEASCNYNMNKAEINKVNKNNKINV